MSIIETIRAFITLDAVIIGGIFLFFVLYGLHSGKGRITSLILSLYAGVLIFINFPYRDALTFFNDTDQHIAYSHLVIFVVIVLLIHHVINFVAYSEYPAWNGGRMFQVFVLAAGGTVLFLSFLYFAFPVSAMYDFSTTVDTLFAAQHFFWWLIAPLAGILLVSRG